MAKEINGSELSRGRAEDCNFCGEPTDVLLWWQQKRCCEKCYKKEHDFKYLSDL